MHLNELLTAERATILDAAAQALSRAHLAHYEAAGAATRRALLTRLFDLCTEAIGSRNLTPVLQHAAEVARERHAAGFGIEELQSAFNVLEEAIWTRVLAAVPPAELGEALGLLSTVLGAGKDRLASTYVALATRGQAPSLDLRQLFAGAAGV